MDPRWEWISTRLFPSPLSFLSSFSFNITSIFSASSRLDFSFRSKTDSYFPRREDVENFSRVKRGRILSLSLSLVSLCKFASKGSLHPVRERFIRILALRLGSSAPRAQLSTAQRIRFGIVHEFHFPPRRNGVAVIFPKTVPSCYPTLSRSLSATSVIPGVGLPLFGKNKGRDVVLFSFRRISRRKCGKIVAAQFRSLFPRGIFERRWPTRYCSSLCPENYT